MDDHKIRKIIHIDMDAFYAAVAQRDDPGLRGLPIGVGGSGPRGVLMTASYEARRFGVGSAMPTAVAKRLCPDLVIVRPDFTAYREASDAIREIFNIQASAVEPLALDEAFLDVTNVLDDDEPAQDRAQKIRRMIADKTRLPSSAGVSFNKFLAKIASNMAKPNGIKVIKPSGAQTLLAALPIEAFFGVGPATARKMHAQGIRTGADLQRASEVFLSSRFGRIGPIYKQLACGHDQRPVKSSRQRKSVSVEETYATDLIGITQVQPALIELAGSLAKRIEKSSFHGQTLTMKIRTTDFQQKTRSITTASEISTAARIEELAQTLLGRIERIDRPVRLLGLGISNENATRTAIQLELPLFGNRAVNSHG